MPLVVVIAINVIYLVLFCILVFFVARGVLVAGKRSDQAQTALIEVAQRAQENARMSSEAALGLAHILSDIRAEEHASRNPVTVTVTPANGKEHLGGDDYDPLLPPLGDIEATDDQPPNPTHEQGAADVPN